MELEDWYKEVTETVVRAVCIEDGGRFDRWRKKMKIKAVRKYHYKTVALYLLHRHLQGKDITRYGLWI